MNLGLVLKLSSLLENMCRPHLIGPTGSYFLAYYPFYSLPLNLVLKNGKHSMCPLFDLTKCNSISRYQLQSNFNQNKTSE